MTTPIPTRFSDEELALMDGFVLQGIANSRSALIRHAFHHLADSLRRAEVGAEIVASYRERPQTPEEGEWAMANAIALAEAEPW